ncbi:hypothetical protein BOX15_Mlig020960g1 [Macrostomum lignano]|uniref:Innexin n=1 Tax=Macrostomum lignano TaxID=282301 RepID=A0A267F7M5_9PLAT|nr:hypothetical protein BOX15_Mlig020960g1 [Macrostomum lignano]
MLTFINILLKQLKSFNIIDATGVLDFADKVSYLLTPVVLLSCSLCIGLRELFSKPLACMAPHKTFHIDYQDESMLEGFCWVQGLRLFHPDKPVPDDEQEWRDLPQINYYMWVPLLLAALAILAHLPKLLWDLASFGGLGVDPAELLRLVRGSAHRDRAWRRDEVTTVADVMRRTLNGGCSCCFRCGRCCCMQCKQKRADCRWSITLLPSYLLVKLIGMANVVLQLIILRQFFGLDLTAWSHWEETAFPSVGICKLQYQALTHLQSIVAFCTISTNVLTEKVALLLSIYLPIVLAICTLSLLLWIYRLTVCRYRFLAKFASIDKCCVAGNINSDYKKHKRRTLRSLDSNFLGTNGLFLLHMILINAGELFTSELIGDLYRGFVQRQGPQLQDRNVPSDTCPETSAISLAVTETSRSAMV